MKLRRKVRRFIVKKFSCSRSLSLQKVSYFQCEGYSTSPSHPPPLLFKGNMLRKKAFSQINDFKAKTVLSDGKLSFGSLNFEIPTTLNTWTHYCHVFSNNYYVYVDGAEHYTPLIYS